MDQLPQELIEIEQVLEDAECLFNLEDIEKALDKMAFKIEKKLAHTNPLVICVMNGGLMCMGGLIQRLNFPLQIDYLHVTRYEESTTGANDLKWLVYPSKDLEDRTIILVDDVLDGGITLAELKQYCLDEGANSVYSAVLVDKVGARSNGGIMKPDFNGLKADNRYLFGYGMDYKGYLRNVPAIFAMPTH